VEEPTSILTVPLGCTLDSDPELLVCVLISSELKNTRVSSCENRRVMR
jgi:hypothetical protein